MTIPVTIAAIEQLPRDWPVPEELARDLRRADVFIQMAVTCAHLAVARVSGDKILPEEVGVFIGTAFGPLETNFESLGSLIDDGEGQISPTLFSHSVYNAAAGYVARLLDIRGPAMTITNYGWPFLVALEEARLAVAAGRITRGVVIGVETYSALLADAYCRFFNVATVPWERSAVAWVLQPEGTTRGGCRVHGINIVEKAAEAADLLTRNGETLSCGGKEMELPRHPLAYVNALSEAVLAFDRVSPRPERWSLRASFGLAELTLGR